MKNFEGNHSSWNPSGLDINLMYINAALQKHYQFQLKCRQRSCIALDCLPGRKVLAIRPHSHTDSDGVILALGDDLDQALLDVVKALQLDEPRLELLLLGQHLQHGDIVFSAQISGQADVAIVEVVQHGPLASLQPDQSV